MTGVLCTVYGAQVYFSLERLSKLHLYVYAYVWGTREVSEFNLVSKRDVEQTQLLCVRVTLLFVDEVIVIVFHALALQVTRKLVKCDLHVWV